MLKCILLGRVWCRKDVDVWKMNLKSLARERIWFLEQVRRKAEKSVTISNGGNFICRKVRGAFQYYLNGEYVKKAKKIN